MADPKTAEVKKEAGKTPAPAPAPKQLEHTGYSEYNGKKLIVFGDLESESFGDRVQMGARKASFVLQAMKEAGPEKFQRILEKFVAENTSQKKSAATVEDEE